jgi:hypothetical protein
VRRAHPPPYVPGDRVRCLVSTATQPMWPTRVELRGRTGTVVSVEWREPTNREPGSWWVTVEWELGLPYAPWPLRAEELEAADAHWGAGGNPFDRLP